MSDFMHKINPFYKFITITMLATILTFVHSYTINMIIFTISILLLILGTKPKTWFIALKFMIPFSIMAFGVYMSGVLWRVQAVEGIGTALTSKQQTGLDMLSRFICFASLGLLISLTTDSFELVKSMQKHGKLPRKFAYGILAAINLVPHMKQEYNNAKLAFSVRGVRVGPLSPKVLFSMLVNCFRWSEMLSIAMHSKGFHE